MGHSSKVDWVVVVKMSFCPSLIGKLEFICSYRNKPKLIKVGMTNYDRPAIIGFATLILIGNVR